jgi:predicted nuclease of predicted toxin-antitoxin system
LCAALTNSGHDIVRSVDVLGPGVDDASIFKYARDDGRAILTMNCADFIELALARPQHSGVFLVYQDNDDREMSDADICNAIANAISVYPDGVGDSIVSLRQFKW